MNTSGNKPKTEYSILIVCLSCLLNSMHRHMIKLFNNEIKYRDLNILGVGVVTTEDEVTEF